MARTVAIGVQSFAELREGKYFYVDKTDFIREWWEGGDAVTLITRPRRFGKTLNMDMLDCFFSMKYAGRGEELFSGLSVWEDEGMRAQQGKWPVIFLSFAGVKDATFDSSKRKIFRILSNLYSDFDYLRDSGLLSINDRNSFQYVHPRMDEEEATAALGQLSRMLERAYGKKVLIFLDEYDAPMQEAYIHGYWEEMSRFMRVLFNNTFKTNRSLRRAVITGVTRITRESMFSDLNNLTVVSTTSNMYETAFGFTEKEVFEAMDEFGLPDRQEVKDWYDGFAFGEERDIYNPWSITNYLKNRKTGPYWANTSSNGLASRLIRQGGEELREQFETLMARDSGSDITIADRSVRGDADINANANANADINANASADINSNANVNIHNDAVINADVNVRDDNFINAHAYNDGVINACDDTCINARANVNARTNANARDNACINVRSNTHDYGYNAEIADDVECREFSDGFGVIEARIDEQVVFSELSGNPDSVWSLLLAAGYLKVLSVKEEVYRLSLVNREVRLSFEKMVRQWFDGSDGSYNAFQRALLSGDVRRMNEYLQEVALSTVSVFDSGRGPSGKAPERFWHGLVLGLSIDLRDRYVIRSNRESGYGRYDVMMIPKMFMTGEGNRKGDLRHPSRPDGIPGARLSADPKRKDAVEEQHIPGARIPEKSVETVKRGTEYILNVRVPEKSVETVKKGTEYNPKVRVPEKSVETGKRETEYIPVARVPENSLETLTGLAGYVPGARIPLSGLPGIIMEFKMLDETEGEKKLSDTAGAALRQIEEKHYEQELLSLGLPRERIRKYGFAFRGKETLILEERSYS